MTELRPPWVEASREFATTHWSVVLAAGDESSPSAQAALEQLCRTYWYPLYSYVRGMGHPPEAAQDLTQQFFLVLLRRQVVRRADRDRGRFRNFLLTALKHLLTNEWARQQAAKRGGGVAPLPLDLDSTEARFRTEASCDLTPDKLFDKRWAMTLLERVLTLLEAEFVETGKTSLFAAIKGVLWGETNGATYAELSRELGMTESAFKAAAHRVRQRYRELLRQEVSHTVATPAEVDAELHYLAAIVAL